MARYSWAARWYDVLSAEPVYGAGRRVAVPALRLRPGDRVLDLACGTGLNLPMLAEAVGPAGEVVGVDRSPQMLSVARGKAERHGWTQARFIEADAMSLDLPELTGALDAVVATYALSLLDDPRAAWQAVRPLLAPGAAVAVVDMQPPTGLARWASPLAHLACRLGGADIHARPWRVVEPDLDDVRRWGLRGGHVQVRVGRLSSGCVADGQASSPGGL